MSTALIRPSAPEPMPPHMPALRPAGPWLRRTVIVLLVILLAGLLTAAGLKGRGYLHALRLQLGMPTTPLSVGKSPTQTRGTIPEADRSGRVYPAVHPDLRFERFALPTTRGVGFTCVAVAPDGRLWAASDDGRIFRFPVHPDGTLGTPQVIDSLQRAHAGPRLLIGFCFDPAAPPDQPVIYATHSHFAFTDAREWSGALTRLSGPNLEHVLDIIVGLPRSVGDHATNQPAFGPDGAIYIPQASNTAFGDVDATWGYRPERLLNGAILRLDLALLPTDLPLDVRTEEGGSYDPFTSGAPLTIYATGVRLAYDLCWADDGRLYAPVNGSSAGGNAPASPDGAAPPLRAIPMNEPDWLLRVTPGRYYGHPNPRQGHYVLNGGNSSAAPVYTLVPCYPEGTAPDPLFDPPIADLGQHQSPNGIIQYRDACGSPAARWLDRTLIICRYSFGGDLIAVRLTPDGRVDEIIEGIPGFTDLANPLDITQDPRTGFLYVSDYGTREIHLLRPTTHTAHTTAAAATTQTAAVAPVALTADLAASTGDEK